VSNPYGEPLAGQRLLHSDRDALRRDRWVVRNVEVVAEQELQRVPAGLEVDRHLGLTAAEVPVVRILRDRHVGRGHRCVDDQVVVARHRLIDTRGRNAHAPEPERHGDGARHERTVRRRVGDTSRVFGITSDNRDSDKSRMVEFPRSPAPFRGRFRASSEDADRVPSDELGPNCIDSFRSRGHLARRLKIPERLSVAEMIESCSPRGCCCCGC
jgi:hypothetical protein